MKKKSWAALMTSAAFGVAAAAQETATPVSENAATEGELTEVVVSAQRRDESIQRVPISIQAIVADTLEQHQVENFDDYTKLLPSVSFQSLGPGNSQLFFRGVTSGSEGDALSTQPTAAVYLDDIPVTTIYSMLDVHIYDVARVEALSGPQGTLFGASSLSGTLRIITNKPDPSGFKAGYDVQVNKFGVGQAGTSVESFVNLPLSDRAALRLMGFYEHAGGYIDNTLTSRTYQRPHTLDDGSVVDSPITVNNSRAVKSDFNPVDTYGGRAALGIDLNDNWTITPTVTTQEQKGKGAFLYDPQAGDLKIHDFLQGQENDKWYQAALAVHGKISNWELVYSGGYMHRRQVLVQDYSYYTVAYDQYPGYTYFQNADGTPVDPTQFEKYDQTFTKQTHELRISSPAGERLNFTAGLFYQRQADLFQTFFYVPGLSGTVQAPDFVVVGDSIYHSHVNRVDRDSAAFTQADFHITPALTLTGGIREYKYRNTVAGFSGFHSSAVNAGCVPYTDACVNLNRSADGSGETHKVSLAWQIDPARMVYATYSTGYRPGGINRRTAVQYNEDTLSNYEIGFKTSWFDHRLRLNGATYYERWKGIQYGVIGDLGAVSFINAGDADIRGVELDTQLKLGGFSLTASGAFNDAKLATPFCTTIDNVQRCDLGVAAPKGTRLPVQPRFKGNVTGRYDFEALAVKPFFQVSMLSQSNATSRLSVSENALLGTTPGFTTFDMSAGLSINGINVEFFGENIFDKRGQLSRNAYCGSSLCLQHYLVYPIKPQFFGLKLSQRF
jgi:iron complex outermembrane recepter protein